MKMKVNSQAFNHLLQWISKRLTGKKCQFPCPIGTSPQWNGARGKSYVSQQVRESTKGALSKRLLLFYGAHGEVGRRKRLGVEKS